MDIIYLFLLTAIIVEGIAVIKVFSKYIEGQKKIALISASYKADIEVILLSLLKSDDILKQFTKASMEMMEEEGITAGATEHPTVPSYRGEAKRQSEDVTTPYT